MSLVLVGVCDKCVWQGTTLLWLDFLISLHCQLISQRGNQTDFRLNFHVRAKLGGHSLHIDGSDFGEGMDATVTLSVCVCVRVCITIPGKHLPSSAFLGCDESGIQLGQPVIHSFTSHRWPSIVHRPANCVAHTQVHINTSTSASKCAQSKKKAFFSTWVTDRQTNKQRIVNELMCFLFRIYAEIITLQHS